MGVEKQRAALFAGTLLLAFTDAGTIVDAEYGRRYAESIPGARFEVIPAAGHFPQIERLETVVQLITDFPTRSVT